MRTVRVIAWTVATLLALAWTLPSRPASADCAGKFKHDPYFKERLLRQNLAVGQGREALIRGDRASLILAATEIIQNGALMLQECPDFRDPEDVRFLEENVLVYRLNRRSGSFCPVDRLVPELIILLFEQDLGINIAPPDIGALLRVPVRVHVPAANPASTATAEAVLTQAAVLEGGAP